MLRGQNSIGFSDGRNEREAGLRTPGIVECGRSSLQDACEAMQLTTSTRTELECKLENGKRIVLTKLLSGRVRRHHDQQVWILVSFIGIPQIEVVVSRIM